MRKVGGVSIDPDIDDVINPITRHDSKGKLLIAPSIDVEKIIICITNERELGYFEYCGML